MKYLDIIKILDQIKEQGYSYIQLSPCQKSRTTRPISSPKHHKGIQWYYQYQPLEFKVGNYYGTKQELYQLTQYAHKLNIKVIADLCLNFVAELEIAGRKEWDKAEKLAKNNDQSLLERYQTILDRAYPPFNLKDFKPRTYYNKHINKRLNNWYMGQLPALKTDTEKVQKVHFAYLKELVESGIDGFRWDCAQWYKPNVLKKYLDYAKSLKTSNYLEVIEKRNFKKINTYNKIDRISDYNLGLELIKIFRSRNRYWIKDVQKLERRIKSFHPNNITFAVNHDTYNCEQSRLFLKFDDNSDRSTEILATCLLLTIKNGVPLIFKETAKSKLVQTGVKFKSLMYKESESNILRTNNQNIVLVQRGTKGLCIINRGSNYAGDLQVKYKLSGIFKQLDHENTVTIKDNKIKEFKISRKTCTYFSRIGNIKEKPVFDYYTDFPLLKN